MTAAAVESKAKQAAASKAATLDMFMSKKRREDKITIDLGEGPVDIKFRSCGRVRYDKLLTDCPPTAQQRVDNWSHNQEKFAPKLLAEVIYDPQFTEAQWADIWKSEDWNRGELGDLLNKAVEVCSFGLDINPSLNASA